MFATFLFKKREKDEREKIHSPSCLFTQMEGIKEEVISLLHFSSCHSFNLVKIQPTADGGQAALPSYPESSLQSAWLSLVISGWRAAAVAPCNYFPAWGINTEYLTHDKNNNKNKQKQAPVFCFVRNMFNLLFTITGSVSSY